MTNVIGDSVLASALSSHLADSARAVSLSSFGHQYSPTVRDDLDFDRRPYSAWSSYGQSKPGCALLAADLADRWRARGIDVFSVHPGATQTEMSRAMTEENHATFAENSGELTAEDFRTPDEGAATTQWALTASQLAGMGGADLEDCAIAPIIDAPNYRFGAMRRALDPADGDRLWGVCAARSGLPLPL